MKPFQFSRTAVNELFSEPRQIFKMERSAKIVNYFQPLTSFAKRSILDI